MQRWRNVQAKSLCRLEVDHKLETGRGLEALEDRLFLAPLESNRIDSRLTIVALAMFVP